MKISKQVLDYYYLTESSFKKSTNEEHIRVASHIINGLDFLKIKKLKAIDATEGYKLIKYFKSYTNRNNNSINKMTNYLKRVMMHYGIATSFHQMKKLPSDTKPFKRLYHEDLQTIIKYVRDLNYSDNSIVYRTYIFLALDSGMRKSELLNIQIENIDFHNKLIYLEETKTGKPRYVPFSDFSTQQLKDLASLSPKRKKLMYNFLKQRDLSSSDIKLFYKRTKEKLGIDRLYTHRFRKTFASLLADNGMPPQYVQKLLDHEKISTTMKYIQFDKIKPLEKYKDFNDWNLN